MHPVYSEFRIRVSHRVKEIRTQKGITQEQMEEGPNGVPYKTVQTVENEQREVYLSTLYRIAKRLDIDIRELFDFKDKPVKK